MQIYDSNSRTSFYRAKTAKSMRFVDTGPEIGGFGKGDDSDDEAMPIIPDLDDVRDEDLQVQVCIYISKYECTSNYTTMNSTIISFYFSFYLYVT